MHRKSILAMSAALAGLAACSGGPPHPKALPAPRAAVTAPETDAVFDLLMAGKEGDAVKLLDRLLKRDPMSANARLLSDSIKRDPKELLGPTSYAYTVRPGDTIIGLAQRYLGNRLKAYQLLRYNALRPPALLTSGQVLRMPGEPARIEPPRRPETQAPSRPPAPPTGTQQRPRPIVAKPAAAPAANPAAARTARAAGLAALNAGDVNRAVGMLRRAASLDPSNPAISRDLARAERIAATVRARR